LAHRLTISSVGQGRHEQSRHPQCRWSRLAARKLPSAQRRWRPSLGSKPSWFSYLLGSPNRMARSARITADPRLSTILRIGHSDLTSLKELLFRRYPDHEWATFAHFGWHNGESDLTLTLTTLRPPAPGELDENVGHVSFQEPYSLRT